MKRYKKKETAESLFEKSIKHLKKSGVGILQSTLPVWEWDVQMEDLPTRLRELETLIHRGPLKADEMLLWVCYDIEDNRIRRNLAKYLERKGLIRMQKSVFIGRISLGVGRELRDTLKELSGLYQSHDSMLIIPLSEDQLPGIHCLGKEIALEQLESKNTLVF